MWISNKLNYCENLSTNQARLMMKIKIYQVSSQLHRKMTELASGQLSRKFMILVWLPKLPQTIEKVRSSSTWLMAWEVIVKLGELIYVRSNSLVRSWSKFRSSSRGKVKQISDVCFYHQKFKEQPHYVILYAMSQKTNSPFVNDDERWRLKKPKSSG